eukprot:7900425-Pyramimonas_sp.AAC.1
MQRKRSSPLPAEAASAPLCAARTCWGGLVHPALRATSGAHHNRPPIRSGHRSGQRSCGAARSTECL